MNAEMGLPADITRCPSCKARLNGRPLGVCDSCDRPVCRECGSVPTEGPIVLICRRCAPEGEGVGAM